MLVSAGSAKRKLEVVASLSSHHWAGTGEDAFESVDVARGNGSHQVDVFFCGSRCVGRFGKMLEARAKAFEASVVAARGGGIAGRGASGR